MNFTAAAIAMSPEHLLLAGIVALILLDITSGRARAALPLAIASVAAAALAAAWLGATGWTGAPFPGQFVLSPPAAYAKAIVLALAIPILLASREDFGEGPFYPLILSSLYGVCLLASADSFLTLFLGIELMSIPVYVLVLIGFRRAESAEAALKYLVLSGTASASFLMGASLIYGSTGSLALASFALAMGSAEPARGHCGGDDRLVVLPQGGHRSLPRLGAGRLRGGQRAVHRLHGHAGEGGRPDRRGARLRHGAGRRTPGRAHRHPAARLHRLGQPHGDAPAGIAPHDRVLLDRARRLSLLRLPGRRRRDASRQWSSTSRPTAS